MPIPQKICETSLSLSFREGSSRFLFRSDPSFRPGRAGVCPTCLVFLSVNRHGRLDLSHYYIRLSYYTRCRFYLKAEQHGGEEEEEEACVPAPVFNNSPLPLSSLSLLSNPSPRGLNPFGHFGLTALDRLSFSLSLSL